MRLVIFIIFAKSAPFYSIKNIVSRYPKNFENGALVLVGKTLFWLHPIGLIVLYVYDSNQPNNWTCYYPLLVKTVTTIAEMIGHKLLTILKENFWR